MEDVAKKRISGTGTDSASSAAAIHSPPVELVLSLPDFLDFFPCPHVGRLVSGLDVLTREECGVSPHAVFNFRRGSAINQRLTWHPTSGDQPTSVDVPNDLDLKFRLMQTADGRLYTSVADLVETYPSVVRVKRLKSIVEGGLHVGDRIKLVRLIWRQDEKAVECRRVSDTKLLTVPVSCDAEFSDDLDYRDGVLLTSNELLALFPFRRRRSVQICGTVSVPGLPANVGQKDGPPGELYFEMELPSVVEASPVDDPGTLVRLPAADSQILVAPDATMMLRPGHSLSSLVTNCRGSFPLLVRVVDWRQQTSVMENHFISPGVEVVLHGTTQQTKVLARVGSHHFLIPLTYRGQFRRLPRVYAGSRQLSTDARDGCLVRIVYLDLSEKLSLSLGDRLRYRGTGGGDSQGTSAAIGDTVCDVKRYVRCERCEGTVRQKLKVIKIPLTSNASFEEVLDDSNASSSLQNIEQLAELLHNGSGELRVQLTSISVDAPPRRSRQDVDDDGADLPVETDITLTSVVVEPAVFASVDSADRPAFQLPLRTDIDVRLLRSLNRDDSPLLSASRRGSTRPRLSTMDRCVELLPADALTTLRPEFSSRKRLVGNRLSAGEETVININLSDSAASDIKHRTDLEADQIRKYKSADSLCNVSHKKSVGFNLPTPKSPVERLKSSDNRKSFSETVNKPQSAPNGSDWTANTASMTSRDVLTNRNFESDADNQPSKVERILSVTFSSGSDEDDDDDDADDYFDDFYTENNITTTKLRRHIAVDSTVSSKAGKLGLRIPDDGNLYNFSATKFTRFLDCLSLGDEVIGACRRRRMDGREFSRLSENEMELSGLLHPVLIHFRRLTFKKSKPGPVAALTALRH